MTTTTLYRTVQHDDRLEVREQYEAQTWISRGFFAAWMPIHWALSEAELRAKVPTLRPKSRLVRITTIIETLEAKP
ncbi:MAG: hypothetical protein U1F68_14960 [Gammaproteobacteria bacterium]